MNLEDRDKKGGNKTDMNIMEFNKNKENYLEHASQPKDRQVNTIKHSFDGDTIMYIDTFDDSYLMHAINAKSGSRLINPDGTWKKHKYLYKDSKGNYVYEQKNPVKSYSSNTNYSLKDQAKKIEEDAAKKKAEREKRAKEAQAARDAAIKKAQQNYESNNATRLSYDKNKNYAQNAEAERAKKMAENAKKEAKESHKIAAERREIRERRQAAFEEDQKNKNKAIYNSSNAKKNEENQTSWQRAERRKELNKKVDDMLTQLRNWEEGDTLDIDDDAREYIQNAIDKDSGVFGYRDIEDYLSPMIDWFGASDSRKKFVKDQILKWQERQNKDIDSDIDLPKKAANEEISKRKDAQKQINTYEKGDVLDIDPAIRAYLEKCIDEDYWYPYKNLEDYLEPLIGSNDTRKQWLGKKLKAYEKEILKKYGLTEKDYK